MTEAEYSDMGTILGALLFFPTVEQSSILLLGGILVAGFVIRVISQA